MTGGCPFCLILAGSASGTLTRTWPDAVALVPLDPVNDGHRLVIPRQHVTDATTDIRISQAVMGRAAQLAAEVKPANILTSIGEEATQSVFHLHLHVIPRRSGDGLMVPWGTTGDPRKPHWCSAAQELADRVDELESGL